MADHESLRCVDLAASFLNFRRAAAVAGLSPAAFSDRVRRLEDELGARLFERSPRSVRLTANGVRLVPQIRRCLAELETLRSMARAAPAPVHLTLGTRWELGLSWIVPALDALSGPVRTLDLVFGDSVELLRMVRAGKIDAAITSYRVVDRELVSEALHDEGYVFVAAPELLDREPLASPDDAARHTLLDVSAELPLFRYLLGEEEPWRFAGVHLLGAIAGVRARVLRGAGVAVLPAYFVDEDLAAGRLRRVMPDRPIARDTFRLWWRADRPRPGELRSLAEQMRALPLR